MIRIYLNILIILGQRMRRKTYQSIDRLSRCYSDWYRDAFALVAMRTFLLHLPYLPLRMSTSTILLIDMQNVVFYVGRKR